jgi:hypothetical protein
VVAACLTLVVPAALAAGDAPADLELIEFLGNPGGTQARGRNRDPDPLWLLDELSRTETTRPAPSTARPVRSEEAKP